MDGTALNYWKPKYCFMKNFTVNSTRFEEEWLRTYVTCERRRIFNILSFKWSIHWNRKDFRMQRSDYKTACKSVKLDTGIAAEVLLIVFWILCRMGFHQWTYASERDTTGTGYSENWSRWNQSDMAWYKGAWSWNKEGTDPAGSCTEQCRTRSRWSQTLEIGVLIND